ncbi:hypothetical protein BGW39_008127, partial [Mortierella sp. 14UC]
PSHQDRRKSSAHKTHHRPSLSSVTAPVPVPVEDEYSQHQAPSSLMSLSKRPSEPIASVSYSKSDVVDSAVPSSYAAGPIERMSPSVTGAGTLTAEVVVLDQDYDEVKQVDKSRHQGSEQEEVVDVDSVDQGQAQREEEEEVVMTDAAVIDVENDKEVILLNQEEEESRILKIESMEVDEGGHREGMVVKSSSEVGAEILQESTETMATSTTILTTTTTLTTTTEQDVEALALH